MVIAGAIVLAATLSLAGCGGSGGSPADESRDAGSGGRTYGDYGAGGGASGSDPTVAILEPAMNGVVKANKVNVRIKVSNLVLVRPGGPPQAGQGHVHYTLDRGLPAMVPAETYQFTGVRKGPHSVTVELVGNDHSPLEPAVRQTVGFTAE
jgi:hypothetical protein